jgi:aryl-alcohol dehydrogenase-like predicted oxidoreductase
MSFAAGPIPDRVVLGGDLEIRRPGFGALHLTGAGAWGEPEDRDAAKALLRRVVALGVNLIDTADSYGPEVSERLIAEALVPYPDDLVIATKGGKVRTGPSREIWPANGRPEHLRAACEGSLKRLRLERIDLYQLHAVDPAVPIEESLGALVELQVEGKIGHIGVSNVSVEELARARATARIVSVQNRYSLADRSSEDVIDVCEREGLVFFAWHPLDLGALTTAKPELARVAAAHHATAAQLALAWLINRSPLLVPIPGTTSPRHLEENVAAANVRLTGAESAALAEIGS